MKVFFCLFCFDRFSFIKQRVPFSDVQLTECWGYYKSLSFIFKHCNASLFLMCKMPTDASVKVVSFHLVWNGPTHIKEDGCVQREYEDQCVFTYLCVVHLLFSGWVQGKCTMDICTFGRMALFRLMTVCFRRFRGPQSSRFPFCRNPSDIINLNQ